MNASSKARVFCVTIVWAMIFGWATLGYPVEGFAASGPSQKTCEARTNDRAAKLVECIQLEPLWDHLIAFQRIADRNPMNGHPSRATGGSGYKASLEYVAALMRGAGYTVTVQPYTFANFSVSGLPVFSTAGRNYTASRDWYVARLSGGGTLTAGVQPVTRDGCSRGDFAGFMRGKVALIQRGACTFDAKVANAQGAGAAAVIIYNNQNTPAHPQENGKGMRVPGAAFPAHLSAAAGIPVVGVASYALGADLYRQYATGGAPVVHLDIRVQTDSKAIDYNLIADSRFGDPNHVVVVEGHLDAIYGAGMLDNASGSSTILEVALKIAKTQTRNHLRFIWFGGEEIGLRGSAYYTKALSRAELSRIAFDIDSDVTASRNYDIMVADPEYAGNVKRFPKNVVPASQFANEYFADYFSSVGMVSRPAPFGNDGTDSNSFSLVGVPNTGILTQQDCCKTQAEVNIWGGFRGNYEGNIPSFDGGCVDNPGLWCDNLSNNDPNVLQFISKGFAYVTFQLAAHAF